MRLPLFAPRLVKKLAHVLSMLSGLDWKRFSSSSRYETLVASLKLSLSLDSGTGFGTSDDRPLVVRPRVHRASAAQGDGSPRLALGSSSIWAMCCHQHALRSMRPCSYCVRRSCAWSC